MTIEGCDSLMVVEGFTFRDGSSSIGGAMRILGGSPRITGNVFTSNYADGMGGAIACNAGALIEENRFVGNGIGSEIVGHGAATTTERRPSRRS